MHLYLGGEESESDLEYRNPAREQAIGDHRCFSVLIASKVDTLLITLPKSDSLNLSVFLGRSNW